MREIERRKERINWNRKKVQIATINRIAKISGNVKNCQRKKSISSHKQPKVSSAAMETINQSAALVETNERRKKIPRIY